MGKIYLHIANANQSFTDKEVSLLRGAARKAEIFISAMFQQFDYEVDVIITTPSFTLPTIAEDGVAGKTLHSRLIMLSIDKQQHGINEDFVFETICHEMSHSLRWEKLPEYAETMFEAIILEGLAVALEEEAMLSAGRQNIQFFLREMQKTSQQEIDQMISVLKDNFSDAQYDYHRIFFTGDDALPRWAGYRLGYYFVKQYLHQTGQGIAQATLTSYKDFSALCHKR
ncbi:MAG: DUF2268 domain-containing putative Zn-dependent protease [Candidatus Saccharibacteria bacterium]|nr:DUF2268 domain-containing putative Zn-dependent protease [Candidatus Saccharibacteria bacterium]